MSQHTCLATEYLCKALRKLQQFYTGMLICPIQWLLHCLLVTLVDFNFDNQETKVPLHCQNWYCGGFLFKVSFWGILFSCHLYVTLNFYECKYAIFTLSKILFSFLKNRHYITFFILHMTLNGVHTENRLYSQKLWTKSQTFQY